MPCVIRKRTGERFENLVTLAGEEWDLSPQVEALERWLAYSPPDFRRESRWVADIGFHPRSGAAGGGPALSLDLLRTCVESNLEIHLSEYPPLRPHRGNRGDSRERDARCVLAGGKAVEAATGYLRSLSEEDLDTFQDEPTHHFYMAALLRKELLAGSIDEQARRQFILMWLHELDDDPVASDLINALAGSGGEGGQVPASS